MNPDESRDLIVEGKTGRDDGKRFRVKEVMPVVMAGYVLRLLAALRLVDADALMAFLQPLDAKGAGDQALQNMLQLLAGCDPQAVHTLITDALRFVEVAPDPQHPGMFRPLRDDDIAEMATLGVVLGAFARLNLLPA